MPHNDQQLQNVHRCTLAMPQDFSFDPGDLGDASPYLVRSRGEALLGGLGVKSVCRHCLQIFTAETIKV